MAKKYVYFNVVTPTECEIFTDYHEALRFYGKSEKPSTMYGVTEDKGFGSIIVCIKSK